MNNAPTLDSSDLNQLQQESFGQRVYTHFGLDWNNRAMGAPGSGVRGTGVGTDSNLPGADPNRPGSDPNRPGEAKPPGTDPNRPGATDPNRPGGVDPNRPPGGTQPPKTP